jgi:hypothetical protein
VNRRALLRAVGPATVALAGCGAPPTDGDGTPTSEPPDETTATVTPPPDDPILLVLANGDESTTVTVTVTRDDGAVFERTVSLAADERRELDPGTDSVGDYALAVSVEGGPERSAQLAIEPYDVRQGSNAIVELGGEEIRILLEE